jgi:hypothetical protein
MREYFKTAKWKLFQLGLLLVVVVLAFAYINGKGIYNKKVAEINSAKQTFGN